LHQVCGEHDGLVEQPELHRTLREQRKYYAARAAEYDDSYQRTGSHDRGPDANASWQADLNQLAHAFDRVPLGGDVVEFAAGTGFWTERLVGRARSLHVIDGSAEMLAINQERLGATAERVSYQVADLFEWQPPRTWDACVFGFWICKVPDVLIAGFLNTVAASIRHGGVVCFVDKAATSDPPTESEERALQDGRRFTIFDHPRPPKRLVELFAGAGLGIQVETIGDRFCLGHGTRS
jgi:SAM-dependent methyltransferase